MAELIKLNQYLIAFFNEFIQRTMANSIKTDENTKKSKQNTTHTNTKITKYNPRKYKNNEIQCTQIQK